MNNLGETQERNDERVVFFMALTFLLFMSLAFTGGLLLQGLGEEKENRIMEDWVGTAPPMAGMLRLVCAIPPTEPDVPLSRHPALPQMG